VISQSGSTAETLSPVLVPVAAVCATRSAKGSVGGALVALTGAGDNPRAAWAVAWARGVLDHDPRSAGRYSVLSLVGLLPALVAGLDARGPSRRGAATVWDRLVAQGSGARRHQGRHWPPPRRAPVQAEPCDDLWRSGWRAVRRVVLPAVGRAESLGKDGTAHDARFAR